MQRIDPFGVRRLEFLNGPDRRKVLHEVIAAEEAVALGRPCDAHYSLAFRG